MSQILVLFHQSYNISVNDIDSILLDLFLCLFFLLLLKTAVIKII